MIGNTFLMEFKKGWKGLLIFTILVLIVAGGMTQLFPMMEEAAESNLEGSENVKLNITEEFINLSWKPKDNITQYRVLEDNSSTMLTPNMVYQGPNNFTSIKHDFEEDRYYAVIGITNESSEFEFVGITTTAEGKTPWDELMDSPYFKSFTGGRNIPMNNIKGFISVEFLSWWFLLFGLYIAYVSVGSICRDFEDKRMDLIFSTPLSRKNYILEKFSALAVYSLLVTLIVAGAIIASTIALGETSDLTAKTTFLTLIGSWPVMLVVLAFSILSAVFFQNSRGAMGISLLFAFSQYALKIVSSISENLRYMNNYGVLGYWDYNEVLFDNIFSLNDFILLLIITGVILVLALIVFDKKDIPA